MSASDVVPLCPGCGWIGERQAHRPGFPPKCGAVCGCAFTTDWLKVTGLPAHLDRARVEHARWSRALAFAEVAAECISAGDRRRKRAKRSAGPVTITSQGPVSTVSRCFLHNVDHGDQPCVAGPGGEG